MYNEEIKGRFLAEAVNESSRAENTRRFNLCAPLENSMGRDLAQMGFAEAKYLMENAGFLDSGSLEGSLSTYRCYVGWCRERKAFENIRDGFLTLSARDVDMSIPISKAFFRDEADFFRTLQKVKELEGGYAEVIAAVFLWLGVEIPVSIRLKEHNVDLDSLRITDENGNVIASGFSPEVQRFLKQYADNDSFDRRDRRVFKDKTYDYFIKRCAAQESTKKGKPLEYEEVRYNLSEANRKYVGKGYPSRLTPTNILKSGYLYRLWELEQSGVDLSATSAKELVEGIYKKSTYRRIIWQYGYYKKAFNL